MNIILISGSPRAGNTEYIMKRIHAQLNMNQYLVLLRQYNINECIGCLQCHHNRCCFNDDINILGQKLLKADFIIFGIPCYFGNISTIAKRFIDRLNPLYINKELKNKLIYFIFVGGSDKNKIQRYMSSAIAGFVDYMELNCIGFSAYTSLDYNEIEKNNIDFDDILGIIKEVASEKESKFGMRINNSNFP